MCKQWMISLVILKMDDFMDVFSLKIHILYIFINALSCFSHGCSCGFSDRSRVPTSREHESNQTIGMVYFADVKCQIIRKRASLFRFRMASRAITFLCPNQVWICSDIIKSGQPASATSKNGKVQCARILQFPALKVGQTQIKTSLCHFPLLSWWFSAWKF